MSTPIIQIPKASGDDSIFSYREKLNPKEYYELLIRIAIEEEVCTWEEVLQWTGAWKALGLDMSGTLTMLEKTLKARASIQETKEYWDQRNRRANEDEGAQIMDKAINTNANKKHK